MPLNDVCPITQMQQREFVLLLHPLLSRKLRRSMASLIPHPPLLAHTIYQALVFDAAMREQGFHLEGTTSEERSGAGTATKSWTGISDVILGNQEWFEAWLAGEKKFAEDQYHAIISAPEAWTIDDAAEEESQDFQPTTSARRLKALIEQITGMLGAYCLLWGSVKFELQIVILRYPTWSNGLVSSQRYNLPYLIYIMIVLRLHLTRTRPCLPRSFVQFLARCRRRSEAERKEALILMLAGSLAALTVSNDCARLS
jgi:hypothetical protein